jgi:hypothetical protein
MPGRRRRLIPPSKRFPRSRIRPAFSSREARERGDRASEKETDPEGQASPDPDRDPGRRGRRTRGSAPHRRGRAGNNLRGRYPLQQSAGKKVPGRPRRSRHGVFGGTARDCRAPASLDRRAERLCFGVLANGQCRRSIRRVRALAERSGLGSAGRVEGRARAPCRSLAGD